MAKLSGDFQVVPQDIFSVLTTQQGPLGAKVTTPDGRVYRYAQFDKNNDVVAGNLLQSSPRVSNHQGINPTVAAVAGATSVTVTLGASAGTVNWYTNGFLVVDSGSGHLGYTYGVASNTSAASSGTIVVQLTEPLVTALATGDSVCLVPNPYQYVLQMPTTPTNTPAGVAVIAGSAASYGWIQTRGVVGVLSDATVTTIGQQIAPSTTTAGATTVAGTATTYAIGNALTAGVSAKTRPVFLTLE